MSTLECVRETLRLALIADLPRLPVVDEVLSLVEIYVEALVMPSSDLGDAFRLAFATWYRLGFLLTGNCRHLANANKFDHTRSVNDSQRLVTPSIVTPEQLLGKEFDT
jgi:hypothetical protein